MKLEEAIDRLSKRHPRLAGQLINMSLDRTIEYIEQLQLDLKAWQLVAHSKRTSERWAKAGPRAMTATELRHMPVTPEFLASLPLTVLRKRAGMGGNMKTRDMINAEIRRRVALEHTSGDIPLEPNPPLAVDDPEDTL